MRSEFYIYSLRDNKDRAAKDYGKKVRNELASSFRGIVHHGSETIVPGFITSAVTEKNCPESALDAK